MTRKVIQWVSILPVNGVSHAVLDETPLEDMPEGILRQDENGTYYGYADETWRMEHEGKQVAVRLRLVEK
jgi:hypothetical protein